MYNVWFCDLKKVIAALEEKVPNMQLFGNIKGNVDGDFIIKYDTDTYLVKHTDFYVWKLRDIPFEWSWEEVK